MDNNTYYQNTNPHGYDSGNSNGSKGMAIVSLVLGILTLVILCASIITGPIAIILSIIVLAKKKNGTGLAIAGLITSILGILLMSTIIFTFKDTFIGLYDMSQNDEIIEEYEETGKIPDFLKELEDKYDIDADEIMKQYAESYDKVKNK